MVIVFAKIATLIDEDTQFFHTQQTPNKNGGELPRRSVDQGLSTSPISDITD
jgi:hypothetical protein